MFLVSFFFFFREKITEIIKLLIYEIFLENFLYENFFLMIFYIFYENSIKFFLNSLLTIILKRTIIFIYYYQFFLDHIDSYRFSKLKYSL